MALIVDFFINDTSDMHLTTDYPWPFLLLCLLLGAVYAAVLYFVGRQRPSFPKGWAWALAALRCVAVSLIAFLLLAPLVKRTTGEHEKPIVVVAQDNSRSILLGGDSAYYQGPYARQMEQTLDELRKDYDVVTYLYGSEVRQGDAPAYDDGATHLSQLVEEIGNRYAGRNVGALVLTGDGIYNQGVNPLSAVGAAFPVYTVALGDTTVRRDAAVAYVRYNQIAYLGNQFPIEVTVNAHRMAGEQATLTVSHQGRTLFSKTLHYTDADFSATEQILLEADKAGLQTYTVALSVGKEEVSSRNNVRTLAIEVIDGRQKVAIVAAAPHPDVAALRQSIAHNRNCEVTAFLMGDVKGSLADYDLVVFHQLPAKTGGMPLVEQTVKNHVPILFVLGSQTDMGRFNSLHLGLEIHSKIDRTNESTPVFNNAFSLFALDEATARHIEQYPPLTAPFGDYRSAANTQSLFTARVGNVGSGLPLLAFTNQGDVRYGFVAGEGLWRWRLADYQEHQNHDDFDALVSKMVVYTSMRVNKDRFHVETKSLYQENETVQIDAQLYNANYELVNTPDIRLTLASDSGTRAEYLFSRTSNSYSLGLGHLRPATYRYTATTQYDGRQLTATGSFVVEALQLEDLNLVADHALLNTIAQTTGGVMLSPDSLSALPRLLRQRDDIKTVVYSNTRYTELLNLPLLLLLLLLLMGAEWGLRKYHGEI